MQKTMQQDRVLQLGLSAELVSLKMASRNASNAQSMIDTAEAAHQEVHNMLLRMREIAVQAANGTLSTSDRTALNAEVTALETEITAIADNTSFAGVNLGTSTAVTFQIGTGNGDTLSHTFKDFDKTKIGASVAVDTVTNAAAALTLLDNAISLVSTRRGELGQFQQINLNDCKFDNVAVNLASARGRIQDTDFAKKQVIWRKAK